MMVIQATDRQNALNDTLGQFANNFANSYQQAQATKRQLALQAVQTAGQISDQTGRQVSPEAILPAVQSGDFSGLGKIIESAPITPKQALLNQSAQRSNNLAEAKQKYYESKAKQPYGPKGPQNVALNPDGSPMTWEQKKQREAEISSEAKRKEEESKRANPINRLESLGAEGRGKVGAIASGLQAIDQMGKAFNAGQTMDYVDSNTPLIGNFISDTDVTTAERTMSEVIGRLQSGGAIGVQEGKTFKDMGPRRGDSKEEKIRKLGLQRDFLNNKLAAFQLKPDELDGLGFKTTADDVKGDLKNQLKAMSREEKIRLLQGPKR